MTASSPATGRAFGICPVVKVKYCLTSFAAAILDFSCFRRLDKANSTRSRVCGAVIPALLVAWNREAYGAKESATIQGKSASGGAPIPSLEVVVGIPTGSFVSV